jgi:hypothetical protein
MKDPVSCPLEGRTFCRCCMTEHLARSESCPTCRIPLTPEKLITYRSMKSMIEEVEVYCVSVPVLELDQRKQKTQGRKRKGAGSFCEWTGKLNETDENYNGFEYAITTCPHDGCDNVLVRREIPHHVQICPHRLMPCE